MPVEANEPPTERLFAALDIPEDIRAGMVAWSARELTDNALRPVAPESLHMTLCFLGRTESSRVREAAACVQGLEPTPIRIRLVSTPVGKPSHAPRVWALEAEAPAAAEVQAKLSAALSGAGLYEPEDRPFWAHLTLARTRTKGGRGGRPREVKKVPSDLPAELLQPFDAVRVSLYRSELRSDGAKYVSLANLNLPPSA
ncbi:MAG: RNA 2',3'-cyclic phosphodiesterase [Actinomycetota bacterium]|nr:RNA 2',3'-cyclic phosphodiesterase [Actinomycetota bacterium]